MTEKKPHLIIHSLNPVYFVSPQKSSTDSSSSLRKVGLPPELVLTQGMRGERAVAKIAASEDAVLLAIKKILKDEFDIPEKLLKELDLDSNILELGLDSMNIMELLSSIEKVFSIELELQVTSFAQYWSFQQLCESVTRTFREQHKGD